MNRITSGPNVNDHLQTEAEGVFACGNVLHVHDLVDYVSEEANLAERMRRLMLRKRRRERKQRKSGWKLQTVCVTPCLSLLISGI